MLPLADLADSADLANMFTVGTDLHPNGRRHDIKDTQECRVDDWELRAAYRSLILQKVGVKKGGLTKMGGSREPRELPWLRAGRGYVYIIIKLLFILKKHHASVPLVRYRN